MIQFKINKISLLQFIVSFAEEFNNKRTPFGHVSKRPSYQFGLIQHDWVVFSIGKMLDYLTNHFDWWIMDHLIGQIFTLIFFNWIATKNNIFV